MTLGYQNLGSAKLEKTFPVSAQVRDVVLAGNGYVYGVARHELIVSVQLSTGAETRGFAPLATDVVRLHPNGSSIYTASRGVSPDDIGKISIESGNAEALYDSQYHGDYSMCGDLWISEDALRIFTKCGNVFRSSDVRKQDMLYGDVVREIRGRRIQHLTHSYVIDKVFVIPQGEPGGGQVWDTQILVYELRVPLLQYRSWDAGVQGGRQVVL